MSEAEGILREFVADHPDRIQDLQSAAWNLITDILSGGREHSASEYQSWAELEWAGYSFDRELEKARFENAVIEAVLAVALEVAKSVGTEVIRGL